MTVRRTHHRNLARGSALFLACLLSFAPPAGAGESAARPAGASVLPALMLPDADDTDGLRAGVRVFVRAYEVVGSTVLSDAEIAAITEPYTNRMMSFADLQALRDALTAAYVDRGYFSSGALLEDQSVADGRIRFEIVEGRLADIAVVTDGRLREDWVVERLAAAGSGPVNVFELERALQALQADPRIRRVEARLDAAPVWGEGRLRVEVEEERALSARLELDNGTSPSIGAERSAAVIEHLNLTGVGDVLEARFERTRGLRAVSARYARPLGVRDLSLELRVRSTSSEVVEDPFESLDIESRSATYAIGLRAPVLREADRRFDLGLKGEFRRSKSFLLGAPFSFAPGVEDGVSTVTVLRFTQDFSQARRRQAFSARSTLSFGIGALGATTRGRAQVADGRFKAWLGQVQYARRLSWLDAQVIARLDVQLSDDPLLGLEDFALGGRASVRGYRENVLVRDNGAAFSVELRAPVWRSLDGSASVALAPFFDVGRGWDRRSETSDAQALCSAGLGVRVELGRFGFELDYARAMRDLPDQSAERDLQDRGIHFRVTTRF